MGDPLVKLPRRRTISWNESYLSSLLDNLQDDAIRVARWCQESRESGGAELIHPVPPAIAGHRSTM